MNAADSQQKIYIIGIGGTGTGALAGLLKEAGHIVSGSDEKLYPPMSERLQAWGIPIFEGYDAQHLREPPDIVIVGNVIRANNPEAQRVREQNWPTLSMPQAVAEYGIGNKHSIVVAGTHGKTTTTALCAHLLRHSGRDPGYLIGGAPIGWDTSFHLGAGDYFVVEGDEYDTAYFDKGPKFLHYRAKTALITSLEFDHADIFDDIKAVEAAFSRLVASVPDDGTLVIWHGATRARALVEKAAFKGQVICYSTEQQHDGTADLWLNRFFTDASGLSFEPVFKGQSLGLMHTRLWGEFSACNALAALAACHHANLSVNELRLAFASFAGVRRRMEEIAEAQDCTLVDDFAHHPTAVEATLKAARSRWPDRRVWAVFEPRSATSRRNIFEAAYITAFGYADEVILASHPRLNEIAETERFSPQKVVDALAARGTNARTFKDIDAIAHVILSERRAGDIVLLLSNGDFFGLHQKLSGQWHTPLQLTANKQEV